MRFLINFIPFMAGCLGFFAWSGSVENELNVKKYEGEIVQKEQVEKVLDIGSNVVTVPVYKLVLSSGKTITVPRPIFQKLNKGDHAVLLIQNNRITLSK
ncbi:hypothetical protein [Fictibacillus barbaricus]|uniref:SpoVT-AbrB domain-containing protein n=1 Tax=Fictibacillus barbaricus TaxID=182136 RepID=A0ABU1TYU1_9BACL|nr:hypothetical protein [Fictibacillus barbaricus]MDR7072385.1 hypothetical protein [Fictibacillus barbaricus]